MGLDIFFAEDVRNALAAANEASSAAAARVADLRLDADAVANLRAYRDGYKAALCTMALAFGISPQTVIKEAASPPIIYEDHATLLVNGSPIRLGE